MASLLVQEHPEMDVFAALHLSSDDTSKVIEDVLVKVWCQEGSLVLDPRWAKLDLEQTMSALANHFCLRIGVYLV